MGPATLTATASASASLYYYVLTAVCLLLGFAGLAFGETLSRWLAPRPLVSSVAVAWLVTVVRFLLEKSAAPAVLVQAIGVTWLAPVAGACIATAVTPARPAGKPLLRALLSYAILVRGFVALVGVVATRFGLGSHYDVSGLTFVPVALTGDTYSLRARHLAADPVADPRAPAAGLAGLHRRGRDGGSGLRALASAERRRARPSRGGCGPARAATRTRPGPQRTRQLVPCRSRSACCRRRTSSRRGPTCSRRRSSRCRTRRRCCRSPRTAARAAREARVRPAV